MILNKKILSMKWIESNPVLQVVRKAARKSAFNLLCHLLEGRRLLNRHISSPVGINATLDYLFITCQFYLHDKLLILSLNELYSKQIYRRGNKNGKLINHETCWFRRMTINSNCFLFPLFWIELYFFQNINSTLKLFCVI